MLKVRCYTTLVEWEYGFPASSFLLQPNANSPTPENLLWKTGWLPGADFGQLRACSGRCGGGELPISAFPSCMGRNTLYLHKGWIEFYLQHF